MLVVSKKILQTKLLGIIIYILTSFFLLVTISTTNSYFYLSVIAVIQLVINFTFIWKFEKTVFSIPLIFLIFTFITHLGHLPLNAFNIEADIPPFFDTLKIIPLDIYIRSIKFVLFSQFFYTLGYLLFQLFKSKKNQQINVNDFIDKKAVYQIGIIFIIIGIIPSIYIDLNRFLLFLSGNYVSTYDFSVSGITIFVSNMWKYGAIMLILALNNQKKRQKKVLLLSLSYLVVTMLTGHRIASTMFIITMFLIYNYSGFKINTKKMVYFGLLFYFLLILLNFVGDFRLSNYDISSAVEDFSVLKPIFDALGEFGVTMVTLCYTIMFIPSSTPYGLGLTYPISLITIFPNVFNFYEYFNNYLVFEYNIPDPYSISLGGSYLGELYFNFGNLGVVFTIFVGIFTSYLSSEIRYNIKFKNWTKTAILTSLIPFLFMWVRSYFKDMVRVFVWQYLLIIVLYYIFTRDKRKTH